MLLHFHKMVPSPLRFLCSSLSTALRRWSSVRASKWLISLAVVIVGLSQIPILIFYTVSSQPIVCLGQPNLFQKINAFVILLFWSVIPTSTMLAFSLLTIRHVKQSSQAVVRQRPQRMKFTDRQLIQITLIQSILFGLTSASGSLGGTFNILDDNSRKDPLELAKQSFFGNILSFVGLLGPCLSFYLCTLSSQLFRRELLNLLYRRHATRVYPMHQQRVTWFFHVFRTVNLGHLKSTTKKVLVRNREREKGEKNFLSEFVFSDL